MILPAWWPSDKPYLIGDVLERLKELPDCSVQCAVTSPPYWGLRDYGVGGQLGLEKTPEEYVANMVKVFAEVKRVLRDDGTLWLNLGDSYHGGGGGNYGNGISNRVEGQHLTNVRNRLDLSNEGLKPKDLVGIPWLVAFALRADGWYLRSDIIWDKPNPMPESVRDRPTKSHEYIFLLTKSARYYYDGEAIKETSVDPESIQGRRPRNAGQMDAFDSKNYKFHGSVDDNGKLRSGQTYPTRNARSVWRITTKPFKGAHFATFPPELPERCIKAGTSEKGCCPKCGAAWGRVVGKGERVITVAMRVAGCDENGNYLGKSTKDYEPSLAQNPSDTKRRILESMAHPPKTIGWRPGCDCGIEETVPCVVLDIFAGSGTTMVVAENLGRIGLGIDLNDSIAEHYRNRLAGKDVSAMPDIFTFPEMAEDAESVPANDFEPEG